MDGDKDSLILKQLQNTNKLLTWIYYLIGAGLFLLVALLIK